MMPCVASCSVSSGISITSILDWDSHSHSPLTHHHHSFHYEGRRSLASCVCLQKADVCLRIPRQELYRLGILYNDNEDFAQNSPDSNTISCDVPIEPSVPMFIFRQGKPRRSRRRSNWRSLPLYLSLSSLSDDADIARLLSLSPFPTIQHRLSTPTHFDTDILQSLPPPALEFPHHNDNDKDDTISIPPLSQQNILDFNSNSGDWTFIHTPHPTNPSPTPSSEPETWILIDDS